MALSSLIIGIASIPTCALLGLGSIVGIVLGMWAMVKAQASPEEYGGKGMAITGIALNGLAIFVAIIVLSVAIPNFKNASRNTSIYINEASALITLRSIGTAESNYQSSRPGHQEFGNLDQLIEAGFLGRGIQISNGYRFDVRTAEDRSSRGTIYRFEAFATPLSYNSTGRRSFYTSEDFVIRGADKAGMQAGSADPPIESTTPYGAGPEDEHPF